MVTYQSWRWDLTMYQCMWGVGIAPFYHMLFGLCKATLVRWFGAPVWI